MRDEFQYSEKVPSVNVHGVRISPGVVKFKGVFDSQTYTETVSVQNISDQSVNIRILNPQAWVNMFGLDVGIYNQ